MNNVIQIIASFEWCALTVILICHLCLVTQLTGLFRVIDLDFVAKEDQKNFAPNKIKNMEEVSRSDQLQHIHRNSIENQIPFILIALLWENLCTPAVTIRRNVFGCYILFRFLYSGAYWYRLSPHRTFVFILAHFCNLYVIGCCVEALLMRQMNWAPDSARCLCARWFPSFLICMQAIFYVGLDVVKAKSKKETKKV